MAKGPSSDRSKSRSIASRSAKMRLSHLRARKQIQQINDQRADRIETGRPAHVKHVVSRLDGPALIALGFRL